MGQSKYSMDSNPAPVHIIIVLVYSTMHSQVLIVRHCLMIKKRKIMRLTVSTPYKFKHLKLLILIDCVHHNLCKLFELPVIFAECFLS